MPTILIDLVQKSHCKDIKEADVLGHTHIEKYFRTICVFSKQLYLLFLQFLLKYNYATEKPLVSYSPLVAEFYHNN